MVGFVDQRTSIEDVLSSTVDGGEVRLSIGDSRDGTVADADSAFWGPDGFISVPSEPDEAGSAMCLVLQDGNERRVLGIRDNRNNVKVGELKPGDRAIVSSGKARMFLKNAQDLITLYTETDSGTGMLMTLNGDSEKALIQVGGSYIEISPDEVKIGAAGGACVITIDASGLSVDGANCSFNTVTGNLGVHEPGPTGHPQAKGVGGIIYAGQPVAILPTEPANFPSGPTPLLGATGRQSIGWYVGL